MKRFLCLILSAALLLPLLALGVRAEEQEFYRIRINAGAGFVEEAAIMQDGELYIPASSFSRYTRYRYDSESQTFLLEGQEADKAFKKVVIDPAGKRLAVGTRIIDLTDCFTVDGVVYLPFCQMLPILNARVVSTGEQTVYVANGGVSLAEILYDFDLHDYYFDLYEEFYGKKGLLLGYVLPSYLFGSVKDFRLDRLDFFFDSGAFEDYREILTGYLKDEDLYLKAYETYNDPRTVIGLITGVDRVTGELSDLIGWLRKMETMELDEEEPLFQDLLVQLVQTGAILPGYESDVEALIRGVHNDDAGISVSDVVQGLDYVYTYLNHVEDNHKMLDAVYEISAGGDQSDVQYRAARAVYDLYGGEVIPALTDRVAKEVLTKALEDASSAGKLKIYELTAKNGGGVWEMILPGDTGDVSVLTLHAGVANEALMSAAAYNLNTEAAVEDYRLSLLLMMLASRKCYKIMADTAEGYGESAGDYRAKIEKLENMIMGLYLAAGNTEFEAYDNFAPLAEENRKLLSAAGIFDDPEPVSPGELLGPGEDVYFEFLAEHPEYRYYALLDINADGCPELLASEDNGQPHSYIDLWVFGGSFVLAMEDIWVKNVPLTYSPENHWLENVLSGTGGGGYEFYSLNDALEVCRESFEYYDYTGYLYNGREVTGEADRQAMEALMARHEPDRTVGVEFLPVPENP